MTIKGSDILDGMDDDPDFQDFAHELSSFKAVPVETPESAQEIRFAITFTPQQSFAFERMVVEGALEQALSNTRFVRDLTTQVHQAFSQAISGCVEDAVRKRFLQTFHADPSAPGVTMAELTTLIGRDFMTEKVDKTGNPGTFGEMTRLDYIVQRQLLSAFKADIANVIADFRSEVDKLLRAAVATERQRVQSVVAGIAAELAAKKV